MKFSIITPSFRNSEWLKLCIASVADQEGVEVEHIVQDSESDDGTQAWLPHDPRVTAYIEKDKGMYDAVNRGWRRATGEIVAYINCDEQYLPGALKTVAQTFASHPEADIVIADTVVIDTEGDYLCHRIALPPIGDTLWVRFNVLTCALFIRREVIEKHQLYFDTQWRDLGDFFWVVAAKKLGLRFHELRHRTSIFTDTGENMNLLPNAQREKEIARKMTPRWIATFRPLVLLHHRFRMLFSGTLHERPFSYELYTRTSPAQRVTKQVERPTIIWRGRSNLNSTITKALT